MHPALQRLQQRDPTLARKEHALITERLERQMAPHLDRLMSRTDLSEVDRAKRIATLRQELEEQVMEDWLREHPHLLKG